MMSWIISLGAGKEQLSLIRAIQAEGYRCIAFDRDPDAAGRGVADEVYETSNRDIETILDVVELRELAGVMAAGTEVPDVVAILAHRLGLPGVPVSTGFLLEDKLLYKQVLKAAGVPHTEVVEATDGSFATVVKPRVSSGSRGVELYLSGIPMVPYSSTHMIERYQPGPEISSESIIWDGIVCTVAFADRLYDRFAHEIGVAMPSFWESERPACDKIIREAAKALGITRGTLKCDLVLTERGPKIIELTCRLSGGPLCELVEHSTGLDYFREAVKVAVGKRPDWIRCAAARANIQVAIGMHGYEETMTWESSRAYIVWELGTCS